MIQPLITVDQICISFPNFNKGKRTMVRAVDNISFSVREGEIFGIVGESGSGKSTLGSATIGLQAVTAGEVRHKGKPMPAIGTADWMRLRRQLQIIFQDPFSSLNPRRTIGQALAEPLRTHKLYNKGLIPSKISNLLEQVGLNPNMENRYPKALSGGQLQRVCIARALAVQPELLVCDEITSALDVSTQAQIISLLRAIKKERNLALIFISHDLGLVQSVADTVGVMYLGQIVERGPSKSVFAQPKHPYTIALIGAAPIPDPTREASRPQKPLKGEIPDPANPPSGCFFRTRCPYATDHCAIVTPAPEQVGEDHLVACHYPKTVKGVERSA